MVIRDDKSYTIEKWMIEELGLKGVQLQIYAIIYKFTNEYGEYDAGLRYIIDFIGATKNTVIKSLNRLVENELLLKEVYYIHNIKYAKYRTVKKGVK